MTMFLRRELRVWPNLDVEVSFHLSELWLPRVDQVLFIHIIYPIVPHNLRHIAHEID